MELSNLELFLMFIKVDRRGLPSFVEERKGIRVKNLDFPLFRYTFSLGMRVDMLNILRSEIYSLNEDAKKEMKHVQETGSGTNRNSLILTFYYESLLNQIYYIMENLAKINLFMFDVELEPPESFSKQEHKIKDDKMSFHPDYDRLIKEDMDWYAEVRQIRSSTTHYMSGLNIFGRADDGEFIPEYVDFNRSRRNGGDNRIVNRNILIDTEYFYNSTIKIINQICEIYIGQMEKETMCTILFETTDGIEFKKISYNQLIRGEFGERLGET